MLHLLFCYLVSVSDKYSFSVEIALSYDALYVGYFGCLEIMTEETISYITLLKKKKTVLIFLGLLIFLHKACSRGKMVQTFLPGSEVGQITQAANGLKHGLAK